MKSYFSVRSLTPSHAELLSQVGIQTVGQLRVADARTLYHLLEQTQRSQTIDTMLPTLQNVHQWVELAQASDLPGDTIIKPKR